MSFSLYVVCWCPLTTGDTLQRQGFGWSDGPSPSADRGGATRCLCRPDWSLGRESSLAWQVRELKTQLSARDPNAAWEGTAVHVGHVREACSALESTEQELTVVRLQLRTAQDQLLGGQQLLLAARCEAKDFAKAALVRYEALQKEHASELLRLEENAVRQAARVQVKESSGSPPRRSRQLRLHAPAMGKW